MLFNIETYHHYFKKYNHAKMYTTKVYSIDYMSTEENVHIYF